MIRILPVVSILLLTILPATAFGLEVHTLSNGLKVLLVEEHKAPVVTIQIWYQVGSRDEVTGKTGLAHLTEHMMFKGTSLHGKGEFTRIIAKAGGTQNAFTGWDYTAFFENLSSDHVALALQLEADRMVNLVVDPKEFELEREVVKEERRLRTEDDPHSLVVEHLYATAYHVHPYHSPVIGWMSDLNSLTRDDVYAFYKKFYVPNNATLVIVGDFSVKDLLPKIKSTLGKVPRGMDIPPTEITEPKQRGERRFIIKKEAQLPFIFSGFHVPNFENPDNYALTVLSNILSSGKSSRLYRKLVYEKKLALSAGGSYGGLSTDPPLFYFYGVPLPGKSIQRLEKAIFSEVDRLKTEAVSHREIEKAKNQIAASFVFGLDSNFYRAMKIGRSETVNAGFEYFESYIDEIRGVTPDDILRVAKTYLTEDNRTIGILTPLPTP